MHMIVHVYTYIVLLFIYSKILKHLISRRNWTFTPLVGKTGVGEPVLIHNYICYV